MLSIKLINFIKLEDKLIVDSLGHQSSSHRKNVINHQNMSIVIYIKISMLILPTTKVLTFDSLHLNYKDKNI